MASRVLSIEINPVVTRICEVDERVKNPKVHKSFTIDTPESVVADGMLHFDEAYVGMLREALETKKVKARRVIFSIASTRIASREVTIPYVKANKIEEVVFAKAEEYFPVNLADYKVAYTLLGVAEDEKGVKKHRLLVLAVPNKLLQGYYELAESCGLEIAALDYMGNSLFQAVRKNCTEGTQMVAKIDESSTLLMIIQNGELVSIRNVAYGVDEAIHTLMDSKRRDSYDEKESGYGKAVAAFRENVYIKDNNEESGREVGAVVGEVTAALEYLINGISRVIDFHNPRSNGHPIEKMYITGLGGSFKGMSELMQGRLEIPVAAIRSIDGLTLPRDFNAQCLGDYVACIGAAMNPLDLVLTPKKDKKQKEKADKSAKGDNTLLAVTIFLGGVIVAGALAVACLLPYQAAKTENVRLQNRIEELKPVENIHNTYVAAQNLWVDADNMNTITQNHNDDLVAFIQEMEQKMPSDIMVLSMVASADNITLNIDVRSKEAAAKVLQELDAFDSIQLIQTQGLTDLREDANTHVVSFSVSCIYTGWAGAPEPEESELQTSDEVLQETMDEVG